VRVFGSQKCTSALGQIGRQTWPTQRHVQPALSALSRVCSRSLHSALCLPLRKASLNSPVDSRSAALPNPARLRHSPAEPPPRLQRPPLLSSRVPPCRKQPLRSSTERAPSPVRPSSPALCEPSAAAYSQTVPGLECGQARARRFTLDPLRRRRIQERHPRHLAATWRRHRCALAPA
jgi:hypothetical protein